MEKLRHGTVERIRAPNHHALLSAPLCPVPGVCRDTHQPAELRMWDSNPCRYCWLTSARSILLGFLFVLLRLSIIHDAPPSLRCLVNKKKTARPLSSPYVKAYDSATADGTRQVLLWLQKPFQWCSTLSKFHPLRVRPAQARCSARRWERAGG